MKNVGSQQMVCTAGMGGTEQATVLLITKEREIYWVCNALHSKVKFVKSKLK
jgi:hypothetical protein